MKKQQKANSGVFRSLSRRNFLLGGAAFGGALFGDAWLRQPRAIEISRVNLPVKKIPVGKEFRVVQLSDLHLKEFNDYCRKVVDETNALAPDMIVLTGDYVEEARNLSAVLRFIGQLQAPAGIFAVQGNWEYWALIEGKSLQEKFRKNGVSLLLNQRQDSDWKGIPISILGIDFPSSSASVWQLSDDTDPARINIALSHVPEFQHDILGNKTDLILSGHTHGGQVRLPLIKPFYLPRYSGPYINGLYRVGKNAVPLYVSRGVGTSVFPVRFLCPPEISLFRLYGT